MKVPLWWELDLPLRARTLLLGCFLLLSNYACVVFLNCVLNEVEKGSIYNFFSWIWAFFIVARLSSIVARCLTGIHRGTMRCHRGMLKKKFYFVSSAFNTFKMSKIIFPILIVYFISFFSMLNKFPRRRHCLAGHCLTWPL
jgi:uncharacterized membrane protein